MRSFVPRYKVVFSSGVFIGRGGDIQRTLSSHEYVLSVEPHPYKTPFSASFAPAKLARAVTPLYLSNNSLCRPQINRAVHDVNDLARKNKDSIEGLAEEVGKFRV